MSSAVVCPAVRTAGRPAVRHAVVTLCHASQKIINGKVGEAKSSVFGVFSHAESIFDIRLYEFGAYVVHPEIHPSVTLSRWVVTQARLVATLACVAARLA